MTKSSDDNIIVGLDIGTATISALVGEVLPDGQINIIGAGSSPSRGMDKGGVNDLESVVKSVQRAVDQAELMAECQITNVFISLSGRHIASRIEKGMGAISDQEVSQEDMDRAIHTAKSIKISDEQRILHVIPQEFTIDYQEGIKNPLGLSGVRMEVSVHLISCHNDMAKNIIKAVERCGLRVEHIVYSGLAASNAVITEDERELGVCVVDIGAGTIDVSIWTGGALRHTEVFSYAGNAVTSDIAFAFGTPVNDAEEIKVKYGCALSELVSKDDSVNVPSVGGRPSRSLQRQTLSEVIEPRYTELMGLVNQTIDTVQQKLREDGIKHHLAAGVVLTGGASQIEGLVECAERVFRNQVRVGKPLNVSGLTDYVKAPYHSTAVGLLHYAKDFQINDDTEYSEPHRATVTGLFDRLRNWIQKEF
ncbi:cell division protein FtsA [Vibrio caribbeanicus]|jgi:cell division protein FtsA|uniref:Cell division protein FtsA n=1 Tax=Vibrio caribbeanicus ATCC BAA-2122 TaxID=796620 RepID=E3BQ92_9VIBR|nr:cell division protein FtsA [Vibrio caribbeanicus]EFP94768.1 cell division protein FtsA [Vibrio caribbeanicus ATCC BAA-2122]MCY9844384.1 cell division protein FtsA [Vibrio caribbeanicus]